METGSTSGVKSPRIAMISVETCAYLAMSTGRYDAVGAEPIGASDRHRGADAEARASYEPAETTPRPLGSAPTITGRPRSSGRSRCSTDA